MGSPKTKKTATTEASVPAEIVHAAEYTIESLARMAKTTVRNIRAYQDRGLINPPERRGRSAVYGTAHLSRLRIIGQLLARGYTLTSIGELLEAWESGNDLGGIMGLETAVSSPWTDEVPQRYSLVELMTLFGRFELSWLLKANELGVLKNEGSSFYAPSPKMIQAGAELVRAGIPLDEMLEVVKQLRANVEQAAEGMVQLVERHLFDQFGKDALPPKDQIPRLGEIIWRLRPLVEKAVHAEVARAMELAANKHLGDRLERILRELPKEQAEDAKRAARRR